MMTIGSLFSGIGGLELGIETALNARVVWQVESNPYCRKVLKRHWPDADRSVTDVREAGRDTLPRVDVIVGGFPCQGLSVAGKRKGLGDERSGLWFEFQRVLSELRPRVAVLENTPNVVRHLDVITGGLVDAGYDCEWQILSANDVGAPHLRKRWFCIAYLPDSSGHSLLLKSRRKGGAGWSSEADAPRNGKSKRVARSTSGAQWWSTEPNVGRVADGVRHRMDRHRGLGNAVVPQCSYAVGERVREVLCD